MPEQNDIEIINPFSYLIEEVQLKDKKLNNHRAWLASIRHERPSTSKPYKIGVYIRFFNQTKYENYLDFHKKQYIDAINLCPKWQLIDFYVDEGSTPPNMENAKDWVRLTDDCMDGKIDLIITQKVSNISRDPLELSICSRLLASQTPPIGIYFISEDIFTLASYYQNDLRDPEFLDLNHASVLDSSKGLLHD